MSCKILKRSFDNYQSYHQEIQQTNNISKRTKHIHSNNYTESSQNTINEMKQKISELENRIDKLEKFIETQILIKTQQEKYDYFV